MVLLLGGICGSKVVIMGQNTDVEVGVSVRETGIRGKGVDRWAVRGFSEPRSEVFPRQSQGSLRKSVCTRCSCA